MMKTIQIRVMLNTFSAQAIKTIQGNMCVSNFQVHLFTNVLKFWFYDPNLYSPGRGRFYFFPSYITFWLTVAQCLGSFLLLTIGNKPLSLLPKGAEHIFLWSKLFFFFSLGEIKDIFQFFFNFHSLTSCALNKKQK